MIKNYKGIVPAIGKDVYISESVDVIGRVTLGDEANIWFGSVLRGDVNEIHVGSGTNIQDCSVVHVAQGFPAIIGEGVTVGHKAIIHGCTIGDNCLIGMGATVLDGAEIGDDSIVGAGSLVTMNKKFPPGVMILGSPARVFRQLTEDEIEKIRESGIRYRHLAKEYMEG